MQVADDRRLHCSWAAQVLGSLAWPEHVSTFLGACSFLICDMMRRHNIWSKGSQTFGKMVKKLLNLK